MNTYTSNNNYYAPAYNQPIRHDSYTESVVGSAIIAEQVLMARAQALADKLDFKTITIEDMPQIFEILKCDIGRTTDFSYGGLLMWVDVFNYQFAIIEDTLFIKGHVENDFSKDAFSLPIGKMELSTSVEILRQYCIKHNCKLRFSAVPEYAIEDFKALNPTSIEIIDNMGDYLYSAEKLSTLSGKKYNKKRNHINQFLSAYSDWSVEPLNRNNAQEAIDFMDLIDGKGDHIPMAVTERRLNRLVLEQIRDYETQYIGAILRGGGQMLAFSIGDIKGDTLYVHIEKALREAPGAFEMINKSFAEMSCASHPEIEYINREDDAGDMGLRMAKESYHPVEIIKKYNVTF